MKFEKEEKTRILPLRWFGNGCEYIAHFCLGKFLYWEHAGKINYRFRFWGWLSSQFYKPYMKWGTVYKADIEDI